jgi:hypothetical protein
VNQALADSFGLGKPQALVSSVSGDSPAPARACSPAT